jgi:hypothetical protein
MKNSEFPRISSNREPVLPPNAREIGRRYASDPKLAKEFLKRVGMLDQDGKLAAPFRAKE